MENETIGSIWRKWDLHFHTPSSYDYGNGNVTDNEIIEKLIENNIEVVAITDHNTIDAERIKRLHNIANGRITILPGIELRCELGGRESIHFCCIFSEVDDLNKLDDLVTKVLGQLKIDKNRY